MLNRLFVIGFITAGAILALSVYNKNNYFYYNGDISDTTNIISQITQSHMLSQTIKINTNKLDDVAGIEILAATNTQNNMSNILIQIDDSFGRCILKNTEQANRIKANDGYIKFLFPRKYHLTSPMIYIKITSDTNMQPIKLGANGNLVYRILLNSFHGISKKIMFIVLFCFYILLLSAVLYIKKIELLAAIIASSFGLIFVFLNPLGSVADEPAHYARSYSVARGVFINDDSKGGTPEVAKISNILNVGEGNKILFDQAFGKNIFKKEVIANTIGKGAVLSSELYSPVNYFPQSIGMILGKNIYFSKAILGYCARLMNLIFYIALLYWSLLLAPGSFKLFLFNVVLLPMSLYQAASVSADGVNFAIIFLFFAYVLRCYIADRTIKIKDIMMLILLGGIMGFCKQTLVLLSALPLIIPSKFFRGARNKYLFLFILLLITSSCFAIWLVVITKYNISRDFFNSVHASRHVYSSVPNALFSILNSPLHFLKLLFDTILVNKKDYYLEMLGILGWLTIPLSNLSYVLLSLVLLMSISITAEMKITIKVRLIGICILLFFIFATLVVFYISWTHVGASTIEGIQGRYFIPILPITIIILGNNYLTSYKNEITSLSSMVVTFALFDAVLQNLTFFY